MSRGLIMQRITALGDSARIKVDRERIDNLYYVGGHMIEEKELAAKIDNAHLGSLRLEMNILKVTCSTEAWIMCSTVVGEQAGVRAALSKS
jgi:hypothetical protein